MIDVVAAVIVRNGRLLLTQRAPEQDAPWLWHCPGGKCEGPTERGFAGESWEDAAIRETREELGLDGPIIVPRDEHGNLTPIAELVFKDRNIAWYAVDIGDQKPLPIEGVGVGWFSGGDLCRMAARSGQSCEAQLSRIFANATLTEPTERVLPALLEHMRRCVSKPAILPSG